MDQKTILLIGSVTSKQYSTLRKRMVRKGMKPVVKRLDIEEYQRKMRRIWAYYETVRGDYFLFEGVSSSEEPRAYNDAKRRQDKFLDEFIAQFGSVYAICWSSEDSPEYTRALAERLHEIGQDRASRGYYGNYEQLRQFRVQRDGKLKQTTGPEAIEQYIDQQVLMDDLNDIGII